MNGHLMPGDERFHDDKQLMADLSALNGLLSRYVLRQLNADAERIRPTSVADEWALAEIMAALASRVQERAIRRAGPDTPLPLKGDATLRQLTSDRPSER